MQYHQNLEEPRHGPAFWALVGTVLPNYEERRGRLAGATLWFGDGTPR